ncbi:response regulator [Fuerstiella marisgermanici]|uniref:Mycobacterial persistence regulator A n=1 Tax=Fuerstiella marisgermanici TaxID=1891926 RepID=A0A1P8WE95_9PLAN|nr:response regulator [Fuerstiella marisgermanici]APZ92371.1 Mycobacterial persistence regulator A [Fuerstiella marisgermanici]
MSDSRPLTYTHRLRNQLNQIVLEAESLLQHNEFSPDEATLRQLERIESLALKLHQVESELKLSVDPEWLESVTRVLVVEDDAMQRVSLATALRAEGCFVATAADGNEAIDYLLQAMSPDVILLDLVMPHCDGVSANRVIRHSAFGGGAKVIALTAHDATDLDLSDFDAYLQKPFRIPDLLDTISAVLKSEDKAEDNGTLVTSQGQDEQHSEL